MPGDPSMPPSASVVVVTLNSIDTIGRCLESVRGAEVVVVDHGSSDGTVAFVRERHPEAELIQQPNRGFAAGVNAGIRAASGAYVLLLNPDAWALGDAVARLVAFAEADGSVGAVGPQLRNPDGSPQCSMRGFPTVWRLATQYLFLARLAPRSARFNAFYAGGRSPAQVQVVEFLKGACLLVRRKAFDDVGPFDESFFLFAEEADWCLRCREKGWRVVYLPDAEAVHIGGTSTAASQSSQWMYREQERSHLRFIAKHDGRRSAERARWVIAAGYLLRAALGPRERKRAYFGTAGWLAHTSVAEVLATPSGRA
jgi:hypothetical protein